MVFNAITPCVPRPFFGNSATSVRLPKPRSLAVRMSPWPSITIRLRTSSPWARRMPRTPVAVRPMARTLPSSKLTALPLLANSMMSHSPSVSAAPTSASPSSRLIAILPRDSRNANSVNAVFFTVPWAVAKNTNLSSS